MTEGRRFKYLLDPLFMGGCALYLLNRFVLKASVGSAFLVNQFNDLLLVPCSIPVLLGAYRLLGLRRGDGRPRAAEIFPVLFLWSVLFEALGPRIMPGTVGDWRDVAAYWAGGLAAWLIWRWRENACEGAYEF